MELDVDSTAPSTASRPTPPSSSHYIIQHCRKRRREQYQFPGHLNDTKSGRSLKTGCPSPIDYLPKELREIIQKRQDQEKAWHVHNLRKAIARLSASENTPKPPKPSLIPLNTKPRKTNCCQEKDLEKKNKPSTVISKPSKDTSEKNLWATVARNGHKKSRVTMTAPLSPTKITSGDQKKLYISFYPCSSRAREALLQTNIGLLDTGAKPESASNWVPPVPKFNRAILGQTEVTKEMLASEIERVTSIRPTSVRFYGTSNIEAPYRTWMAYFDKSPRPGFRVFDESGGPTGDYRWVSINGITFLNVYKAPHDPSAVRPLLRWIPPLWLVTIGDFNSVHRAWKPGATNTYGHGDEIERWAERFNLSCLIIGQPTHRAGNTLDLAWLNIGGARAWVARNECITNDFFLFVAQSLVATAFRPK
ncbi:hypothetical protein EPUL_001014 [Erysiphe pulchra]|uniref:Endonuclease/exonuclease/phosphatase domain-containing protein n=1 Tax=Erysiphe pulchra TaxID=225359 RepID=A0A2S4Q113_9PEZI|nr:hypothetical protein EPUL_001014 [Erysiphe pulchra]